jgi:ketosteroid isomerase-like protein
METANHLNTVDGLYAAFAAQDAERLRALVTDDFRVEIPLMDHLPLQPVYEGTARS